MTIDQVLALIPGTYAWAARRKKEKEMLEAELRRRKEGGVRAREEARKEALANDPVIRVCKAAKESRDKGPAISEDFFNFLLKEYQPEITALEDALNNMLRAFYEPIIKSDAVSTPGEPLTEEECRVLTGVIRELTQNMRGYEKLASAQRLVEARKTLVLVQHLLTGDWLSKIEDKMGTTKTIPHRKHIAGLLEDAKAIGDALVAKAEMDPPKLKLLQGGGWGTNKGTVTN